MASGNSWIDTHTHLPSSHSGFDLRPLSTGEVLDRTFQLYRFRFALFAGLAVLPAAVSVVMQAMRLLYSAHESVEVHTGANLVRVQVITAGLAFVSIVVWLLLYGITQAATTWAVSSVYLGEPATIRTAYQTALKHWFRYTLIVLRQIWAAAWLPWGLLTAAIGVTLMRPGTMNGGAFAGVLALALGLSLAYAIWAYIRVSLAVPASVIEGLGVRASMSRSKKLLVDRKVRVLLLLVLLIALYVVILAIRTPLTVIAVRARGTEAFLTHAVNLAIGFLTATLVGPVGAIAVCLFYFDERVRREGFDIEWMMSRIAPAAAANEPPALQPPSQEGPAGA